MLGAGLDEEEGARRGAVVRRWKRSRWEWRLWQGTGGAARRLVLLSREAMVPKGAPAILDIRAGSGTCSAHPAALGMDAEVGGIGQAAAAAPGAVGSASVLGFRVEMATGT